jgi:hypothetical protein
MHIEDVFEPAALQPCTIGVFGKIFRKKKDEVQRSLLAAQLSDGTRG